MEQLQPTKSLSQAQAKKQLSENLADDTNQRWCLLEGSKEEEMTHFHKFYKFYNFTVYQSLSMFWSDACVLQVCFSHDCAMVKAFDLSRDNQRCPAYR